MSDRILIVGAGSIGLKHLRAFAAADPSAEITVIDADSRRLAVAREHGAQTLAEPWESVDITAFDGVVICVPSNLHVPFASRCIREGVNVLCEKPLSHNWDGVEDLVDLAQSRPEVVTGVAFVRRYHPAHEYGRELARSGQLGDVLAVRISSGQPFTTYRPDYREIYYSSRDRGGGCTLDFASHFLDLVQYYCGPVKSVQGYARHLALKGVEVDDTVAASFDFETSPALGVLHVNQFQPVNENLLEFAGTEGCLRIREPSFQCEVFSKGASSWDAVHIYGGDYLDALRRQAAAFLAAIGGGEPMKTSFADAARTLRRCLDLLEAQPG